MYVTFFLLFYSFFFHRLILCIYLQNKIRSYQTEQTRTWVKKRK